jgi:hypothetical protein
VASVSDHRNLPNRVNRDEVWVVTQFEIGAHVLTAGSPLRTQAMRPLYAAKFKLSHYRGLHPHPSPHEHEATS